MCRSIEKNLCLWGGPSLSLEHCAEKLPALSQFPTNILMEKSRPLIFFLRRTAFFFIIKKPHKCREDANRKTHSATEIAWQVGNKMRCNFPDLVAFLKQRKAGAVFIARSGQPKKNGTIVDANQPAKQFFFDAATQLRHPHRPRSDKFCKMSAQCFACNFS